MGSRLTERARPHSLYLRGENPMDAVGRFGKLATRLEAMAEELETACFQTHLMVCAIETSVDKPENSWAKSLLEAELTRLEEAAKLLSKSSTTARAAANRMHTTVGGLKALGA